MKKLAVRLGLIVVMIYIGLCAVMYFAQDRLLYFPSPERDRPGFHALRLKSGEATVKVWELHPGAGPALVYFGGQGDDVGGNLSDFDAAFPDRAIYLVNYRGYGGSTGVPREVTLISDAEVLYDWVAARHTRVVAMGRSLGTGVATALASRRPVVGLVLVTPYDSIAHVASDRYPWLPVRMLIKDSYDSAARIGQVKAPVLVLIAGNDESILRPRTVTLVAAISPGLAQVVVFPKATHNDIDENPAYWPALQGFLAR
jgi:pimeloyl-ACP methyl ester carboxylesterase